MTRHFAALLLLIGILLPVSSHAFDGQRKGFVLGFGVGYSPIMRLAIDESGAGRTEQGLSLAFPIGYAWNNRNMLIWEGAPNYYWVDLNGTSQGMQGVWTLRWYHYFSDQRQTTFTTIGLGKSRFALCNKPVNDAGLGVVAGGGYQLIPHIQAGLYIAVGFGSFEGESYTHTTISLLITAVAY